MNALFLVATLALAAPEDPVPVLEWSELPALPGTSGLGGPFVGVAGGALVVAGGANFPDGMPWEGGQKVWYEDVFLLEPGATKWTLAGSLPEPLAYGGALTVPEGLVLIGGSDGVQHHGSVRLLTWEEGELAFQDLPSLPVPTAFPAAAAIGSVLYLAAGSDGTGSASLTHAFWSLDLAQEGGQWEDLPPWPGPARHKAVAVGQKGGDGRERVWLFSGEVPLLDEQGELDYDYRTDGYVYDPAARDWRVLGDLPVPVAAACAAPVGASHVLVFSGSTGAHVHDPDPRPGFPSTVRSYHTITDAWSEVGDLPQGVVTTGVASWEGGLVIPTGEVRPGVRTPDVVSLRIQPLSSGFGLANTVVLVLYLLALVAIGVAVRKRSKGAQDFFLAGGRIPWWAAGISIFATQLSAITFVSTPALAYATDWLVLPGKAMILLMAPVVVAFYLPFFCRLNLTTAYEYLERRFNVGVRLFGSLSFIAFQLVRMAVVLYLPALALAAITGIDVYLCILVMGILSTAYTALGGMEAVVWTDVLQTVVLLGGMGIAIFVVAHEVGGFGVVLEVARADDKLRWWNPSWSLTELTSWSLLLGTFALQFGPYTTDQAVVQRYLTMKDEGAARRGVWLNGLMAIPVGLVFMALGTCLFVFYKQHPAGLSLGMENDEILPLFVSSQLPAGLSGLVIAGIFAASMSSLDSSMHSIATTVTVDGYRRFHPEASDAGCLKVARGLTLVLGLLAVVSAATLATYDIASLWLFFQGCLGLVSSGLVGVFMLGIFTRRAHGAGVLIGAAASVGVLVWATWFSPMHFYLYAVVGIGTCVTVGYLASLCLPAPVRDLGGLTRGDGGAA